MVSRVADVAAERGTRRLVGRERELDALLGSIEGGGPFVTWVHGIAGIGKTALVATFAGRARAAGSTVLVLDCGATEPTEPGLLAALAAATGVESATTDAIVSRLAEWPRAVIVLDRYEVFRLMDTWLRQALVPALPATVRLVVAGREPPVAAWLTSPVLDTVRLVPLDRLPEVDALHLLETLGVGEPMARRLNGITRGHPLAIRLAAATSAGRADLGIDDLTAHQVIDELSRIFLADVPDPLTRRVVVAASLVRRVTQSLLRALLPDLPPQDSFERLAALPFVEPRHDGLIIHDSVRQAIANQLRATDPTAHRDLRRAAWRQLRSEVRTAAPAELWRYTADMLHLIENPVVREAFFPSGAQPLAVEPALPDDRGPIELISSRHDGPASTDLLRAWWAVAPDTFFVVRDRDGQVRSFFQVLERRHLYPPLLRDDPVVAAWFNDLRRHPLSSRQHALGLRRWLDLEVGELPCPSQAACWLDVKRTYMLLRPDLRWMYTVVRDAALYWPVVERLGFRLLPGPAGGAPVGPVAVGDAEFMSVVLDFGADSVDGWLARLVATELGMPGGPELDERAHEARIDDTAVTLTPLEFGVLQALHNADGRVVTRVDLLETAWGESDDIGSNVVDAVVRRLRAKLGPRGSMIETVRGAGYRLRGS